jgi:hypothetical protein
MISSLFKRLRKSDEAGIQNVVPMLISVVIAFVIAAALYGLVQGRVDNMTNVSHEDYVGEDAAGLVSMAPLFYWLAVILTLVGVSLIVLRDNT